MKTYILPYKDLNPQPLGRRVTPLTIKITYMTICYLNNNNNNYDDSRVESFTFIKNNLGGGAADRVFCH